MKYTRASRKELSPNPRLLFLDVVESNGTKYAVYLPLDNSQDMLIRKVVENEDACTPYSYEDVEDEQVVARILAIYAQKIKA